MMPASSGVTLIRNRFNIVAMLNAKLGPSSSPSAARRTVEPSQVPGTSNMSPDANTPRVSAPLDGAELPGAVQSHERAQPPEARDAGFRNGHWTGVVYLLPFVIMLVVHELLGISDALLAADEPGDDDARTYNTLMVAAFYLGNLAFVVHACALAAVKGRGWPWLLRKLIFLSVYWAAVLAVMNLLAKWKW